jgi:hypothetical protein
MYLENSGLIERNRVSDVNDVNNTIQLKITAKE